MKNEKALAANERPFLIREWKPAQHGTLRGFVSILLPSGLIVNGIQVHDYGGHRSLKYPVRAIQNRALAQTICFFDPRQRRSFERALLNDLRRFRRRGASR